jgi:nucleoside-diphosphate-sugar epimerase
MLDFTYIEDLVSWNRRMLCIMKKLINETFNFTYGRAREVNELVSILKNKFKT